MTSAAAITLRNSWRSIMLIVCTPENYNRIAADIHSRVVPKSGSEPSTVGPRRRGVARFGAHRIGHPGGCALFILPDYLHFFLPLLTIFRGDGLADPLFGYGDAARPSWLYARRDWDRGIPICGTRAGLLSPRLCGLAVLVWFSWRSRKSSAALGGMRRAFNVQPAPLSEAG